jgi:aryl-alcohol dehydrogenase-like predicted oxidoreductase
MNFKAAIIAACLAVATPAAAQSRGHPAVAAVIPGALLPEHIARNVGAFRHAIPGHFGPS